MAERRGLLLVSAAAAAFVLALPAGAYHSIYSVIYAGPKTWLPGYSAASAYDFQGDRWYGDGMYNINPSSGCVRLVFIDGNGAGAEPIPAVA